MHPNQLRLKPTHPHNRLPAEYGGAGFRQATFAEVKDFFDNPKASRANALNPFLVMQANLYVTQQLVRFVIEQYRDELVISLQANIDDHQVAEDREAVASDLLNILHSIPIQSIATNGPSLVHKVRFVASTLLDTVRKAETAPASAARAHAFLWDFLSILSEIERNYLQGLTPTLSLVPASTKSNCPSHIDMSSDYEGSTKSNPVQITEDEAAVYDRQIRLWGLEAQQRMRNATILIVRLRGTATEAIKNIVLAGIGKLVIVDTDKVSEEDLGTGFFFRDDDVGKKKVDAAKPRIESLNPLVTIQALSHDVLQERESLDTLVRSVDLVCVTDWDREGLIRMNEVCRRFGKPFYAGGTFGLMGYIFCDLLKHDYISPDRSAPSDAPRNMKASAVYSPLHMALRHQWSSLTRRQTKELNPAVVHAILAMWEYQYAHFEKLPESVEEAPQLLSIANSLLETSGVNKLVLDTMPRELIETLSTAASHEFSPVCAVVGGMLAQDILKALAAREAPIANFFVFDGTSGSGTVCRMNM
ncbi:hypothetical protein J3R82DRAFT_9727 [Butyriboletus roseoflavus]|nr:hypothetical protein J3R82DRAFT_9727 [Butyriboletus roseoflavus]